jgi:hypothetical protein
MVLFQNCVWQLRSPTKMAAIVQFRCYWKQLWSRWSITGSWEPLVVRFLCEFPIGSYVNLSSAVQPSWSVGGTTRHNFGREPSNDYVIKVWFQLSNWFQTRIFLCEFETTEPISTKLCWDDPFQNWIRHFRPPTEMAATAELNLT